MINTWIDLILASALLTGGFYGIAIFINGGLK